MRWILGAVSVIALVLAIGIAIPAANAALTDNPYVITMDMAPAANAESPPAAESPPEIGKTLVNPDMNILYKYYKGIPSSAVWNSSLKTTYTVYPDNARPAWNEEGYAAMYGNPLRL